MGVSLQAAAGLGGLRAPAVRGLHLTSLMLRVFWSFCCYRFGVCVQVFRCEPLHGFFACVRDGFVAVQVVRMLSGLRFSWIISVVHLSSVD